MDFAKSGSCWVWTKDYSDTVNQYVTIRQWLPKSDKGTLYISCDTNYAVWINGQLIDFGQYPALPKDKYYDKIKLPLLAEEENLLCVLAYYQGVGTSCYAKGKPGVIYTVETDQGMISNKDARISRASGFIEGEMPMVSKQLGPTFSYDARKEADWLDKNYDDTSWEAPLILPFDDILTAKAVIRPVKKTDNSKRSDFTLLRKGYFTYRDEKENAALCIQNAALTVQSSFDCALVTDQITVEEDYTFLILDLGEETAGYLELDIEAPAGVQIDIGWGEHLTDGCVRCQINYRHFACTYYTKEGKNRFMNPFRRIAGRYLQLHFKGVKAPVTVCYAGIRKAMYPVKQIGKLTLDNALHQRIFHTAVHTLRLCMHEHYEDTPWREQSLYAFDARNQALFGYPVFKNYEFAKSNIKLLGTTLGADGFIDICAPSDTPLKIPGFSLLWIVFCAEYVLISGDQKAGSEFLENIDKMISIYNASLQEGLLPRPQGKLYWNFYDWAEDKRLAAPDTIQEPDAIFNMYLCYALLKLMDMKKLLGLPWQEDFLLYQRVKKATHQRFYDAEKGLYRVFEKEDFYPELAQALAIVSSICPDKRALRKKLAESLDMEKVTLCTSVFKYEALLQEKKYYPLVLREVEEIWGKMLFEGATSFYETIKGEKDFSKAGSLCHGWSAVPIYVYEQMGLIQ